MNTSWIDLREYHELEGPTGPGFRDYVWQALFACQIHVPPYQEWVKLKWGFNASALVDENLDRQRWFLESQHRVRNELGLEEPDRRTLALRFICRPGERMQVAIIGKIHAHTQSEGMERALAYLREVQSIFPYDYELTPARSADEFAHFSGAEILDTYGGELSVAEIRRFEVPIHRKRNAPTMQGLWQSAPRAHEQIWRMIGGSSDPLILNLSLRATVLFDNEREHLRKHSDEIASIAPDESVDGKTLAVLKQWNQAFLERRLNPWKKLFYLQIHCVGTGKVDDSFFRIIGSTIALGKDGQTTPGYQVVFPRSGEEAAWRRRLKNLDLIFSTSYLRVPRLSEVADLDEVCAAMRVPYSPPEIGVPDLNSADPGPA